MRKRLITAAMLVIFLFVMACAKKPEPAPQPIVEQEIEQIEAEISEEAPTPSQVEEVDKQVKEVVVEVGNLTQKTRPKETILKEGQFKVQNAVTFGNALIVERENGKKFLVFERFSTTPFPQTNVYLSLETTSNPAIFTEKGINLGPLKAEKGEQEYEIPDDAVIEIYRAVILFTPKKNAVLAYAPLNPILKE